LHARVGYNESIGIPDNEEKRDVPTNTSADSRIQV
jgi:hypothetical protein